MSLLIKSIPSTNLKSGIICIVYPVSTNNWFHLQIIVFDDDSVEAYFKDGSLMQLSPCGSCYQYIRCGVVSPISPKVSQSYVRQRCCFATSETKSKVEFAIKWRNHFAQRPYLPADFQYLYNEVVHSYKDITSYTWPSDIKADGVICENEKQNVCVSAVDDLARLSACKNLHFCEVDHLVKLSRSADTAASSKKASVAENGKESILSSNKAQTRKYLRVKHIFPISLCPGYWRYPVSLAKQVANPSHKEINELINSSHAPQPISAVCEKQFLHSWRMNADANTSELSLPASDNTNETNVKSLKLVWSKGAVYWIMKKCDEQTEKEIVGIEVWLSDDTIMESQVSSNFYYAHMTYDDSFSAVKTKRFYSPTALPMDSSLKTVLLRAIRLQSYNQQILKQDKASKKHAYCWHDDISGFGNLVIDTDKENLLENLFENAEIAGLGSFSVASNSVQVVFDDGTTLYISLDQNQLSSLSLENNLSTILCRVLFANGDYMESIKLTQTDSHLSRYLKPASDWLLWLGKPKYQRVNSPFYSDTIFSQEKLDMVDFELEKINRFNYLLDSASFSSTESKETSLNSSNGERNASAECELLQNSLERRHPKLRSSYEVGKVLANTSQAISDIDNLIKTLRS